MLKVGNTLRGTLIGMFKRKDTMRESGESDFFQVQINQPCEVRSERGEDAKMIPASPGDIVNVNYGPKTKPWADLVADIKRGAVYEVLGCIIGGKVKLQAGKNMHNFDVFQKMVRAPSADVESDVDFEGSAEDEASV